jgi:hypothetical protein
MEPAGWEAGGVFPAILSLVGQRADELSEGEVESQLDRNRSRRGSVCIEALSFSAVCAVGVLCSYSF